MCATKIDDRFSAHCAVVLDRVLLQAGVPRNVARSAVVATMRELRSVFGGSTFYMPVGRVTKDERAAEAYARYAAGESIDELAASYGFTRMWIAMLISHHERHLKIVQNRDAAAAQRRKLEKRNG